MYALVDGNNFYVSCERVFRPSLNGQPVIVLSNDGCAIARSNQNDGGMAANFFGQLAVQLMGVQSKMGSNSHCMNYKFVAEFIMLDAFVLSRLTPTLE